MSRNSDSIPANSPAPGRSTKLSSSYLVTDNSRSGEKPAAESRWRRALLAAPSAENSTKYAANNLPANRRSDGARRTLGHRSRHGVVHTTAWPDGRLEHRANGASHLFEERIFCRLRYRRARRGFRRSLGFFTRARLKFFVSRF